MRYGRVIVPLILAVFLAVGCAPSWKVATVPSTTPSMYLLMNGKEFEVLGDASGTGCVLKENELFTHSITGKAGDQVVYKDTRCSYPAEKMISDAKSYAVMDAMKKFPDADIILEPRYEIDYVGWKACVHARGKAVKIKLTPKE